MNKQVKSSRPSAAEAKALHRAVTKLVKRYQFRDRNEICGHGLSVSQCYALEILAEAKQGLAAGELAEQLYLDVSSTTRVVDQLVAKSLARRDADRQDRRVSRVNATSAGVDLVRGIQRELIAREAGVLAPLSPVERGRLVEALEALAEVLEQPCAVGSAQPRRARRKR